MRTFGIRYGYHSQNGAWVFTQRKILYALKFPWNRAWFSERNGYRKPLVKLWGFRLFKTLPTEPNA